MPAIHLLDKAVAELIAAGEVVERPASVVKELTENAIDAGATDISVEIKGGGIGYIRVSDNGCGIPPADLPKAFLRHATSKVRTQQDLSSIATLGFRGEALASISAMSRMEMRSRQRGGEGVKIKAEAGEIGEPSPVGCPDGTTVIVRDLFYNTPARMKFLRRDIAEGNAVAQVLDKAALSHPEISFRFIRDQQTRLRTSGSGDLLSVIAAVYGRDTAEGMLPVDYLYERSIHVTGYIGAPSNSKPSRTFQTFYINSRFVKTRTCGAAVEEAFKGSLMVGRFPVCVLNLEIPPEDVDVNVHPAKTEVRFIDERPIFQSLFFAVKSTLSMQPAPLEARPRPAVNPLTIGLDDEKSVQENLPRKNSFTVRAGEPEYSFSKPLSFASPGGKTPAEGYIPGAPASDGTPVPSTIFERFRAGLSDTIEEEAGSRQEAAGAVPAPEQSEAPEIRLIGEIFSTYILLEQGEDFLLVDKHAAHEGMLYRRIRENAGESHRQVLLTGVPVTLSMEEYTVLSEHKGELEAIGFLAEDFGAGTLIVRESPALLAHSDIAAVLSEAAGKLLEGNHNLTPAALDALYYSIACKSAVRAGDRNSREELMEIVHMLREDPNLTHCAHGRPIVVRLSRYKLERMFGRQA
jgi:DNA mismatch repair protein MutL